MATSQDTVTLPDGMILTGQCAIDYVDVLFKQKKIELIKNLVDTHSYDEYGVRQLDDSIQEVIDTIERM